MNDSRNGGPVAVGSNDKACVAIGKLFDWLSKWFEMESWNCHVHLLFSSFGYYGPLEQAKCVLLSVFVPYRRE